VTPPRSRRPGALFPLPPFAQMLALLLFAAAVPLSWCERPWLDPSHPLSFQPLVPLAAAYLAWHRRTEIWAIDRNVVTLFGRNGPQRGARPWLVVVGAGLILLACFTKTAGMGVLGLLLAGAGVIHVLRGGMVLGALASPLCFLLTMVPWPDSLVAGLTFELQLASTAMASHCLAAIGIPNEVLGNALRIGGYQLEVSPACSGMGIVFPTMAAALWYALLARARCGLTLVLLTAALALSALMNVLRVAAMGIVGEQDPAAAERLHDLNSWIFTLAALGAVYLIARYLGLRPGGPPAPETEEEQSPDAPPSPPRADLARRQGLAALLVATGSLSLFITARFARAGEWLPPLPERIVGAGGVEWRSQPSQLSAQSLAILGNPKWDARLYHNALGEEVAVCFIAAGSFDAYHDPTVCMTGNGFHRSAERLVPIDPTRPEESRQFRSFVFRHAHDRTAVVLYYWLQHQDGGTDTANRMGTYRDLWARLKTGWGAVVQGRQTVIVRVLAVVPPHDLESAPQARRNVRRVAEAVQRAMVTEAEPVIPAETEPAAGAEAPELSDAG